MDTLKQLASRYKMMPNGGARLTVNRTNESFGNPNETVIGNGYAVIARFAGYHLALASLEEAGFEMQSDGTYKLNQAKTAMTTYFLHYNQHGGIIKFGADDNSTAQTIASALLKRMAVDQGGVLYTKEDGERTTVLQFDRCGGININGVHACHGGCK